MTGEQLPLFHIGDNGDISTDGVPEFHWVDGVLHLGHEDDHYCPAGAVE